MSKAWHRPPACGWMKVDASGEPHCIYRALGTQAAALELARFTFLDQWFVDDETKKVTEGCACLLGRVCSPETCERRLPRVMDAVYA
jgi:hypothetical protein